MPLKSLAALALAGLLSLGAPASAAVPPGAFVKVAGGELWVESCQGGPQTIVLIHDGILHSAAYDEVWPILCRSFHVVRYDRRGYGRSPAAAVPYSPIDDLAAVMRSAGAGHATLVGASAGGGLTVDFTLAHPQAVDHLILVGPAVSGLTMSEHFLQRNARVFGPLRRGDLAGTLANGMSDPYLMAPHHDVARQRMAALLGANPQNLTHKDPATDTPDAAPRLGAVHTPTLILVGESDIPDVHAWAGALEALIPGARRVVVPDAGHLMYLEHPQDFSDRIIAFVRGA